MKNERIMLTITVVFLFSLLSATAILAKETAIVARSGETIQLDATKLDSFSGLNIKNVSWDFDDNSTGVGITVSHSYTDVNAYRVNAIATDNNGVNHTGTITVIYGGAVPFIPDSAPYVSISFVSLPSGIFTLTVEQKSSSGVSTSDFKDIGKFFDITSDLPNGNFKSLLILRYDDADNDGIVDGTNISENSLDMYFYDGTSWVKVTDSVHVTYDNFIAASIDHFTFFALLSPTSSTTSQPTTTQPASQPSGGGGGNGGGGGGAMSEPTTTTTNIPSGSASEVTSSTTTSSSTTTTSSSVASTGLPASIADNSFYLLLIAFAVIFLLLVASRKKILKRPRNNKKSFQSKRKKSSL